MEQNHAPCLGLGLASALAAHTLLLAIPPCRYSFFYIEYHPYKDLWSRHIDSVTNGSNTDISSSIDPVDHPHVYTQSLHQHLIVQRFKPDLSYTRCHRVSFNTPSISILSLGLSILSYRHFFRFYMNSTTPARGKHENTTSKSTIRRLTSAFKSPTIQTTANGFYSKLRSFKTERSIYVKHGPKPHS